MSSWIRWRGPDVIRFIRKTSGNNLRRAAIHFANELKKTLSKQGGFRLTRKKLSKLRQVRRRKGLNPLRVRRY